MVAVPEPDSLVMADFGSGSGDGAGGPGNGAGTGRSEWGGTDSEPDDDSTGGNQGFPDGDLDGSGSGQGPNSGADFEDKPTKTDIGRGKKPGKTAAKRLLDRYSKAYF